MCTNWQPLNYAIGLSLSARAAEVSTNLRMTHTSLRGKMFLGNVCRPARTLLMLTTLRAVMWQNV